MKDDLHENKFLAALRRDLKDEAPTALALLKLRERVQSRPSAGPITKTAQEAQMARSALSRLLAPATIEKVAQVEKQVLKNPNMENP